MSRCVPEQQPGPFFKAENQHYCVDERFVSLNAAAEADFVSSEREDLSQGRTKSWFVA